MQVLGALANVLQFYTQKLLVMYVFAPPKKPYSASTTSTIAYGLMLGADFVSLLIILLNGSCHLWRVFTSEQPDYHSRYAARG